MFYRKYLAILLYFLSSTTTHHSLHYRSDSLWASIFFGTDRNSVRFWIRHSTRGVQQVSSYLKEDHVLLIHSNDFGSGILFITIVQETCRGSCPNMHLNLDFRLYEKSPIVPRHMYTFEFQFPMQICRILFRFIVARFGEGWLFAIYLHCPAESFGFSEESVRAGHWPPIRVFRNSQLTTLVDDFYFQKEKTNFGDIPFV